MAALAMAGATLHSEPERDAPSEPARARKPDPDGGLSHYLRSVRPAEERDGHAWNVKRMLPRLLSPRPREKHPPPLPQCRALAGDGTYTQRIQPYFEALSLPAAELYSASHSTQSDVRSIVQSIKNEWTALHRLLAQPPGPLRCAF
ncbi:MAG: hypothetical protein V3T86_08790 [Planctomycetota bacterium]